MTLRKNLDNISAPYLYRIAYLANNYRDPLMRDIEKKFSLTMPEVVILFSLANFETGTTTKDIAAVTKKPKNTLSRGVHLLTKKKLIVRKADQSDSRKILMFITRKGKKLYAEAIKEYEASEHRMIACLSENELAILDKLLTKMSQANNAD